MPILEFQCKNCAKVTERIIQRFKDAEETTQIVCPDCGGTAPKIISTPLPAHFYGSPDGYANPSPTKRHSYKLSTEKGNKHSGG
jgi:putative FmdB family regulatory protein